MKNLTNLFKIIELTRSQPQYGYIVGGVMGNELSNLAEHHFLVTFIAWQIALYLKKKGAKINIEKVIEYCLVHDLGEIFGGDIGMPYAKINPRARKLSRLFEEENQNFLARYFGEQNNYFLKLVREDMNPSTDEAIIAKIADYLEVTHFKFYIGKFSKFELRLIKPKLMGKISAIKDPVAKRELSKFAKIWLKELPRRDVLQVLFSGVSKKARKTINRPILDRF